MPHEDFKLHRAGSISTILGSNGAVEYDLKSTMKYFARSCMCSSEVGASRREWLRAGHDSERFFEKKHGVIRFQSRGNLSARSVQIAVDTQGLPHAIAMTTAEVTDRKGAIEAFSLHKTSLSSVVNILAEGGYIGQPFADGVCELQGAAVEIAKRNELHTFVVILQRWGVERSLAWL